MQNLQPWLLVVNTFFGGGWRVGKNNFGTGGMARGAGAEKAGYPSAGTSQRGNQIRGIGQSKGAPTPALPETGSARWNESGQFRTSDQRFAQTASLKMLEKTYSRPALIWKEIIFLASSTFLLLMASNRSPCSTMTLLARPERRLSTRCRRKIRW